MEKAAPAGRLFLCLSGFVGMLLRPAAWRIDD
jgi:hypothetical protein